MCLVSGHGHARTLCVYICVCIYTFLCFLFWLVVSISTLFEAIRSLQYPVRGVVVPFHFYSSSVWKFPQGGHQQYRSVTYNADSNSSKTNFKDGKQSSFFLERLQGWQHKEKPCLWCPPYHLRSLYTLWTPLPSEPTLVRSQLRGIPISGNRFLRHGFNSIPFLS